jgi:predicted N-acetyltransferase YhbS
MILFRDLLKEEIEQVWEIDRSEVIENIYYFENDALVLKPEFYNMTGWPPGEAEAYHPILLGCFTQGGWFHGIFEDTRLIGIVVLDKKFIGKNKDTLQLKFLHVNAAHRSHGYGGQLFELARLKAEKRGASKMYISATPSENTINFYLKRACTISEDPDPILFDLEPDDIHLE